MAREPNVVAKSETEKTTKRPTSKPQVSTQEAKDLRALINTLSEKNSPQTSKDVTVMAKQTLKMVAQSQKSESAAFRKEATKALLDFRNFVEKTDKVNESRRNKLMSDIDNVALDAKGASFMMLSIAKQQAKNIKEEAARAASNQKIKIKQMETSIIQEAELKAKQIHKEAKLKSKLMTEEQKAKMKAISEERKLKYTEMVANANTRIQEKKDKLRNQKDALKLANDNKRIKLEQDKADFKTKKQNDALKFRQDRVDAALKIKKLKNDLRDDYNTKVIDFKNAKDKSKQEQLTRNKARIQKLREMQEEHKAKLKKIEADAKADGVLKKIALKERVNEINEEAKARKAKHERNAGQLTDKIKGGIYDANPLIHAAVEIGSGIVGHFAKRMGDKKKEKQLNKLKHTQQTGTPNPTPNATPAPTPPANPGQQQNANGNSGGMFGGILSMIPSVTSLVSGIFNIFKNIGGMGKTMMKIIGGGRGLAFIGGAAVVINGIFDFMDGFNNASALFGDKFGEGGIAKKIFSGFTNVFASIFGLVDDIAGWMGFDTDLKKTFQEYMVKLYTTVSGVFDSVVNAVSGVFQGIVSAVRSFAGTVGSILSYIPGAGGAAKALQAFASAGAKPSGQVKPPEAPTATSQIVAKKSTVDDLKDQIAVKKVMAGPVQAVVDNSIKSSQTNFITQKLDTRNNDSTHRMYGYGGLSR